MSATASPMTKQQLSKSDHPFAGTQSGHESARTDRNPYRLGMGWIYQYHTRGLVRSEEPRFSATVF